MELTSSMAQVPRRMQQFHEFTAGAPQRLDHFQCVTYDVQAATDFWTGLGMRMSEYTATDGTDELWGTWMEVKGNTDDLVFTNGRGPRLHHFAYTVPDATALLHAADVAGGAGVRRRDRPRPRPARHVDQTVPRPARSRPAPRRAVHDALPVHRPRGAADPPGCQQPPRRAQLWGMPASRRWFFEASEFPGGAVRDPLLQASPATLEDVLSLH